MLLSAETQTHRAAQCHCSRCVQKAAQAMAVLLLVPVGLQEGQLSTAPQHSKGLNPGANTERASTEDVIKRKPSTWHSPEQPETFQKENKRSSNVASM